LKEEAEVKKKAGIDDPTAEIKKDDTGFSDDKKTGTDSVDSKTEKIGN